MDSKAAGVRRVISIFFVPEDTKARAKSTALFASLITTTGITG